MPFLGSHLRVNQARWDSLQSLNTRPDINGGFGFVVWTKEVRGAHKVGSSNPQTVNRNVVNQGAESIGWVDFQASLDSPVHGKSNTVQTNALRLLAIVKY